ncbi:hypothetical protein SLA2020_151000 [Shorea laevis]
MTIILKETLEQLNVQPKKARNDLIKMVREIYEEGKEYISKAAENSSKPRMEIKEAFSSPSYDFIEVSNIVLKANLIWSI